MGAVQEPARVLLIVAVTSRYKEAIQAAIEMQVECWGPLACASEVFDFTETNYYAATMGHDLKKQFLAFQWLIDPGDLCHVKLATNEWEAMYASMGHHPEERPVNIDPGYITLAKLVLASTKDHAHRLYLADGIYAEVTLAFRGKQWQPLDWTYPDYRRADFQEFFSRCRQYLLEHRTG